MTEFLAYAEAPTAGQAGHLCANINGANAASTLVRATDAAVDCALAVCDGATPGKTIKVPTTAAEAAACLGVLLDPVYLQEIGAAASYAISQPATVAEEAQMWVNSEGTVAVNDPVFVRILTDGGSNAVKGTLSNTSDYPSGGIVITPDASFTAALTTVGLTLSDGTNTQTFQFSTDASPTTAEVAAGLVAAIDASDLFASTGTVTISVTSTTGIVEVVALDERLTLTTPARAHRRPGWRWAKARTGAGLTRIKLQARR